MLALVVAVGLTSVFAISGVSGAATAGADEGVTNNKVKIGFIYSKTAWPRRRRATPTSAARRASAARTPRAV
jgi:hypothetical protein